MALSAAQKTGGSKTKASSKSDTVADDVGMPSEAEVRVLQGEMATFLADARMERILSALRQLSMSPPQVILMEGGIALERKLMALFWALQLNCEKLHPVQATETVPLSLLGEAVAAPPSAATRFSSSADTPCLHCPTCIRLLARQHRDLFFLDGQEGSIKIEDIREMRGVLGEPPREAAYRVVIFHEAQSILEASANALLKSLEEPKKATVFVLLVPQRERLLPTLVSRSMCLTLPWPDVTQDFDPELERWCGIIASFLQSGTGLFAHSSLKGEATAQRVQSLIEVLRKSLAARIKQEQSGIVLSQAEALLQHIPFARLRMVDELLAESQDSLIYMVNPALVLEWLATRLYLLQVKK